MSSRGQVIDLHIARDQILFKKKQCRAPYENFTQSPGTSKALHSSSVDAAGIQQASSSVQDDVHF
jgi:hypothetical protein